MNNVISALFCHIPYATMHSDSSENFFTLDFLQYNQQDVEFFQNFLKNLNLNPKLKEEQKLDLPETEFLSLRKAIYNLCLYNLMSDSNNWEYTHDRMIFKNKSSFLIPNQVFKEYFNYHNINFSYSDNDFAVSKSDFIKLKRLNRNFHPLPLLQGDKSIYNPLSNEEWQIYKDLSYIWADFYPAETCPVKEDDFWRDMQNAAMAHPYNNLILRNNIKASDNKDFLLQLHLSPLTDYFKEKKAAGIYNPQTNFIQIPTPTYNPIQFFTTFFHELNHQNQFKLKAYKTYSLLTELIVEADSKAITLLNQSLPLYHLIQQTVQHNIQKDTYKPNLISSQSLEEKIVSLEWGVRSSVEEEYHQFIFDILLAKDREAVYQILNQRNIHLTSEGFNNICHTAEEWRSYYYNYYKDVTALNPENSIDAHLYKTYFKLNVQTTPEAVLSHESLKEFGYAIPSADDKPYTIKYNGLTPSFIKELDESVKKGDSQQTISLFKSLQKQNPILKPIVITTSFCISSLQNISNAVHAMSEEKPLAVVLNCFNYNTTQKPPVFTYSKPAQR